MIEIPQNKYIKKLKSKILNHTSMLKKRVDLIPNNIFRQISYNHDIKNEKINIDGQDYIVKDAVNKVLKNYQSLKNNSKVSSYRDITTNFTKKSILKKKDDVYRIYQKSDQELQERIDSNNKNLLFCLSTLKSLKELLVKYNKEREKEKMVTENTNWILELCEDIDQYLDITCENKIDNIDMTFMNRENDEEIKSLYEACSRGEISLDEREDKIKELRDNSFFENAISDPIYFESALSIIDDIIKKQKEKKSLKKDWEDNDGYRKVAYLTNVSEDVYDKLLQDFKTLRRTTSSDLSQFHRYRTAYNEICKFTKIPKGAVIIDWEYSEGNKLDKNYVSVRYCYTTKKIDIPDSILLYHKTPNKLEGDALNPTFKSKNGKSWFYPEPRCYFTIHKKMPNAAANLNSDQLNMYTPKTPIKQLNLDPGLLGFSVGALYVNTKSPIPMRLVEPKDFIIDKIVSFIKKPFTKNKGNKEEDVKESVNYDILTNEEKFDNFKSVMYEYTNENNIDTREELIALAREYFNK